MMIISMADLSVLLTRSRKIVFITGNDHSHVGDSSKDNVHKHGDYGFGGKNKERKRILEFSEAMNMTMRDKLYKKFIKSHLMHQKHWLIIFCLGEIKQSFRKIYNAY